MDVKKIEYWVNMLAARIHLLMNYQKFVSGSEKMLIVEGNTDKTFLDKMGLLCSNVKCIVANTAFKSGNGLSPQNTLNCKNAIINVVYGLNQCPTLITCPVGFENWQVYGMIDMDYDESDEYTRVSHLFITDTHDLETLMLSTDIKLLQYLEGIITFEDVKMAYFMAYQLSYIKNILIEKHFSIKPFSAGNSQVDYKKIFNNEGKISLLNVLQIANENNIEPINRTKLKKLNEEILNSKRYKKVFDKNGIWRNDYDTFDYEKIEDFWMVVNGHDILGILKYINPEISNVYTFTDYNGLDREFELALIDKYDYVEFYKTNIFKKMVEEQIIEIPNQYT